MGFSQFVRLSSRHVRSTCQFFSIEFLRFYIHLTGPLDLPPVLIALGLCLGISRALNNYRDTRFSFFFNFSIFLVSIRSDLCDRFDRWKKELSPEFSKENLPWIYYIIEFWHVCFGSIRSLRILFTDSCGTLFARFLHFRPDSIRPF